MMTVTGGAERPLAPARWRAAAVFWATGVVVVGTALVAWWTLRSLVTLVTLLGVALFFTVVLTPFVDIAQRRLHVRRTVAAFIVFIVGLVVLGGIVGTIIQPLTSSSGDLTKDLPQLVEDAERGRGRVGEVLRDLGVQKWVGDNLPEIRRSLGRSDGPLVEAGVAVVSGIVAGITVAVLVFLMLVEGPLVSGALLGLFPVGRAERIRRVGGDAARAMTGYALGNLVISGLAGLSAYTALRLLGVPFALALAVWVAFADLIPLVGATLGAIPPIFVALLISPRTAVIAAVFFALYQLFENHAVQPLVMARTVRMNPLAVLLVVIAGVEIAGLLGALLALPLAGAAKVVIADFWPQERRRIEELLAPEPDATGAAPPTSAA